MITKTKILKVLNPLFRHSYIAVNTYEVIRALRDFINVKRTPINNESKEDIFCLAKKMGIGQQKEENEWVADAMNLKT